MPSDEYDRWATLCGPYRYALGRRWGAGPSVAWVMLNPSTADAMEDDPTIRRCIGFSKSWGYGGLTVVNLYAWRATDPRELHSAVGVTGGLDNQTAIRLATTSHELTVCAWGAGVRHALNGTAHARRVFAMLENPHALGTTKAGHPRHPLYLSKDTPLKPWSGYAD